VQLPFNQELKRKVVIRYLKENHEVVRVYVKGAPEYVVPLCSQTLDNLVQPLDLQQEEKIQILASVVGEKICKSGQKALTYAYKDIRLEELTELSQTYDTESEEFREMIENDLVYLGTFGLDDPLRKDISESIQYIKYGHPNAYSETDNL
jgi:magnesium-transporting ATPase (P-type)